MPDLILSPSMPTLSQHLERKYGKPGTVKREHFEKKTSELIVERELARNTSLFGRFRSLRIQALGLEKARKLKLQSIKKGLKKSSDDLDWIVGQMGTARTDLKYFGEVVIHQKVYSAFSDFGFIRQGTLIRVLDYQRKELHVIDARMPSYKRYS
ncbi:MAG: hypothetical protein AAF696_25045 [Bacteroidota bacterium]